MVAETIADTSTYSLTGFTMDEAAIELGVYFVMVTICMFMMLEEVRGRPGAIGDWLLFRKLEPFRHFKTNPSRVTTLLTISAYMYVILPFLLLIGWFFLIYWDLTQEKKSVFPALCLLCLGLAFLLFGFVVMRIRWTNFRFKTINIVGLVIGTLLLTVYQGLMIFGYDHEEVFFPYSAFFLNFNSIFLAVLVFMSKYSENTSMLTILQKYFPRSGQPIDEFRQVDLNEEIEA